MNRRTFLTTSAVISVGAASAGCLGFPSGSDSPTPTPSPTPSPETASPTPASPSIFDPGQGGASSVDTDALETWLADVEMGDLTETEREDVFYMREEEKLARDVYLQLLDEWGLQIHSNISDAEVSHMDAMLQLVEKYGLEDPATGTVGTFTNDYLQGKHDELLAWGLESALDSLKVGCRIEEIDMRDIQVRLDRTDEPAIQTVYENLLAGSRNHLRAFYRVVTRRGGDYEAAIISQAEFDAIVESDFETGPNR